MTYFILILHTIKDNEKSLYCSRTNVKAVFKDLIDNANARYIFLSYNNEGLMTPKDIEEIMSVKGDYGYITRKYSRFKADKDRRYSADETVEYLHYVICNK